VPCACRLGPHGPRGRGHSGRRQPERARADAGREYARAALTKLGVWQRVAERLVRGENVRAALAYVARGEAPLRPEAARLADFLTGETARQILTRCGFAALPQLPRADPAAAAQ
jgi:ABC-type molybdate transport system substrate-binding protein